MEGMVGVENYINNLSDLSKESKDILNIIQKKGPITKKELLDITGLKLTTLNRFMMPLLKKTLIQEIGQNESTGGRKPLVYGIDENKYSIIGVDISRTYTRVVLTNLKMNIIRNFEFSMDSDSTPQNVVKDVNNKISEWQKEFKEKIFLGIGIGAIGPIDRNKGIILNPKNFASPGWYNINISKLFKDNFDMMVVIDNGVNMAALAEYYFGSGKGFSNIAYFNCGIGIRTGIIIYENIIRTRNDMEDSFAHMVIDINGEECSCGSNGCIESICSIHSIKEKFVKLIKEGNKTLINKSIEDINYIDICNAAEYGDEICRKIIIKAGEALGIGISNFIKILNIEHIILSGPLVRYSNLFYDNAVSTALNNYYKIQKNSVIFVRGGYFQDNSIAVGAAANLFEIILKA